METKSDGTVACTGADIPGFDVRLYLVMWLIGSLRFALPVVE
jgi:hypothetical protein